MTDLQTIREIFVKRGVGHRTVVTPEGTELTFEHGDLGFGLSDRVCFGGGALLFDRDGMLVGTGAW